MCDPIGTKCGPLKYTYDWFNHQCIVMYVFNLLRIYHYEYIPSIARCEHVRK